MSYLKYTRIKEDDQYSEYCELLEKLVMSEDDSKVEEIDLLTLLIEDYNQKVTSAYASTQDPVQILQGLLEENNWTQSFLAKRIGVSPQLINDILKYRREITKSVAYRLAQEFSMAIDAFVRPYRLKKAG
jgi:antitoxin component HigA of HigAB toxin-antitoxin module